MGNGNSLNLFEVIGFSFSSKDICLEQKKMFETNFVNYCINRMDFDIRRSLLSVSNAYTLVHYNNCIIITLNKK